MIKGGNSDNFFKKKKKSYRQHQQNVNSIKRISQKTFLKVCPPSSSISSFWEHIISKKQTIKGKKTQAVND